MYVSKLTALMATTSLTMTITLAAPATAPSLQARDNTWTLQGFTRSCDDIEDFCHYAFTIRDNNNGASTHCDYYDVVNLGVSTRSARYSGYTRLSCASGSPFYINQGYSSQGFIVVVPVNTQSNVDAFFGYPLSVIGDGQIAPDQTEPVYST